ncbi:DUF6745 domain-containing protein [Nonomuraea sp. NPDC000554]|uniref:DUF6745 domain-containing protein n=1 Tax=Nonomuraea sp. NPDC000554 TaxID=3154259 RepID=UPI0033307390
METLSWERVAFATGAGGDAEAGVRQAYREAGLPEPEWIITLGSPAAGAVAAAWLTGDAALRERLKQTVLRSLPEHVTLAGPGAPADLKAPAAPETSADLKAPAEAAAALGAPTGSGMPAGPEPSTVPGRPTVPGASAGLGSSARAGASVGTGSSGGVEQVAGPVEGEAFSWEGLLRELEVLSGREGFDPGRSVRDAVRTVPWERARTAAHAELGPAGWAALWAETGGRLWPQVNRIVADLRRSVADLGEDLRHVTLDAVLGQHEAPWLSAFDGLDGLKRAAEASGWWWPYERLAIVTERPAELHLDDLGRLHRADGPAMAFSDGFALNAWHGMPVPAEFGATMSELTPERIRDEENAELRRVMLEHFGLERYLAESGAQPQHSDETGVLWRIELLDDEPVAMVEVVNSTPEPDGTRRTYFLRVPPWVRRAREGVAWTFGLSEQDYIPQHET